MRAPVVGPPIRQSRPKFRTVRHQALSVNVICSCYVPFQDIQFGPSVNRLSFHEKAIQPRESGTVSTKGNIVPVTEFAKLPPNETGFALKANERASGDLVYYGPINPDRKKIAWGQWRDARIGNFIACLSHDCAGRVFVAPTARYNDHDRNDSNPGYVHIVREFDSGGQTDRGQPMSGR
jgi:hypothetical protein